MLKRAGSRWRDWRERRRGKAGDDEAETMARHEALRGLPRPAAMFMVGRGTPPQGRIGARFPSIYANDHSREKYALWSAFRRGLLEGTRYSATLAFPILNQITSFTLGNLPGAFLAPGAAGGAAFEDEMQNWLAAQQNLLITAMRDSMTFGDAYLLMNPDGSVVALPPDITRVETGDEAREDVDAVEFSFRLTPAASVTHRYMRDRRQVIRREGGAETVTEYPNLYAPFIPVTHFAYNRDPNDVYGYSLFGPLLPYFESLNEIMERTIEGVKRLGQPPAYFSTQIFSELHDDLKAASNAARLAEARRLALNDDVAGIAPVEAPADLTYDIALDESPLFFLPADGKLDFARPGPLADDSMKVAYEIFTALSRHAGLPEWVWGGPIPSSRASVDAQAPAFSHTVAGWRRWVSEPLRYMMALRALASGRAIEPESIDLEWPAVLVVDEREQRERIKQAADYDLIRPETHLARLGLVRDPAAEVAAAAATRNEEEEFQRSLREDLDDDFEEGDDGAEDS